MLAVQTRNKLVLHTIVQVADAVVCFVSGRQCATTLERSSEQLHMGFAVDSRNARFAVSPPLNQARAVKPTEKKLRMRHEVLVRSLILIVH